MLPTYFEIKIFFHNCRYSFEGYRLLPFSEPFHHFSLHLLFDYGVFIPIFKMRTALEGVA